MVGCELIIRRSDRFGRLLNLHSNIWHIANKNIFIDEEC